MWKGTWSRGHTPLNSPCHAAHKGPSGCLPTGGSRAGRPNLVLLFPSHVQEKQFGCFQWPQAIRCRSSVLLGRGRSVIALGVAFEFIEIVIDPFRRRSPSNTISNWFTISAWMGVSCTHYQRRKGYPWLANYHHRERRHYRRFECWKSLERGAFAGRGGKANKVNPRGQSVM